MTSSEVRDTTSTTALPRPRPAVDDEALAEDLAITEAMPEVAAPPQAEAPHFPWPEPWRYSRGARPRTEFWDVRTASWRSRGPGLGSSSTTD